MPVFARVIVIFYLTGQVSVIVRAGLHHANSAGDGDRVVAIAAIDERHSEERTQGHRQNVIAIAAIDLDQIGLDLLGDGNEDGVESFLNADRCGQDVIGVVNADLRSLLIRGELETFGSDRQSVVLPVTGDVADNNVSVVRQTDLSRRTHVGSESKRADVETQALEQSCCP